MSSSHILIVEDEGIVAADLRLCLQALNYGAATAPNGEIALELAAKNHYDLALLDINLGRRMDGIDTGRQLSLRFGMGIVFLTAHADPLTLARAQEINPCGYLLKPFREEDLRVCVEMALHRMQAEKSGQKRNQSDMVRNLLDDLRQKKSVMDNAIRAIEQIHAVSETAPGARRKRGRPLGSKNKKRVSGLALPG